MKNRFVISIFSAVVAVLGVSSCAYAQISNKLQTSGTTRTVITMKSAVSSATHATTAQPFAPDQIRSVLIREYYLGDFLRNKSHSFKSVVIPGRLSSTLCDQLKRSKVEKPPTKAVVAPAEGPSSIVYTVTIRYKDGRNELLQIGPWGPTFDITRDKDMSPGISRATLERLLAE